MPEAFNFIKKDSAIGIFRLILQIFSEHPFHRIPPVAAAVIN